MEKFSITKIIDFSSRFIPYPDDECKDSLSFWRYRLFYLLMLGAVYLGLIAYIPSMWLSIKDDLWGIAAIDSTAYFLILLISFSKKIKVKNKIIILVSTFYILGLLLLLILGPIGAGFNWFFMFPLLSALLLDFKSVIYALMLTLLSLIIFSFFFLIPNNLQFGIKNYSLDSWLVNSVNFWILDCLAACSISGLIHKINNSLKKEKEMLTILQEKQEKLQIEKQKAEESDKLKSMFLANLSHEIHTPMNAILGFSNLLDDPAITDDEKKIYIGQLHDSGEQLIKIIDDIVEISKIESRQVKITKKQFDLVSVLEEILYFYKKIILLDSKLEIKLNLPKNREKYYITTDLTKFRQIFNNLIDNAIKFTSKGFIEIGFDVISQNDENYYQFYVSDTGIGIVEDDLDAIFERFRQGQNKEFRKGIGLGLSISKSFVELLGGEIKVDSHLGVGAVFYFTLPFNDSLESNDKSIYQENAGKKM